MEQLNPYIPPQAELRTPLATVEETRRLHRDHEAGLRGLGLLMLLSGAVGTWVFAAIILQKLEAGTPILSLFEGYAWLLVFLGGLVSAVGLFGLRRWAWVSAIVVESLTCLMIVLPELSFSWAAVFHGAIALSLLQPKTRNVVTPEYRHIIAQTPTAKRGTSAVAKVLLVMIVLLVGLGIAASFLRQ